jgi:hypothetical protein
MYECIPMYIHISMVWMGEKVMRKYVSEALVGYTYACSGTIMSYFNLCDYHLKIRLVGSKG